MTIQVKNLWKSFDQHDVLRGLELEAAEGETIVILGRSGSGKSVLLRLILGLETPDAGEIFLDQVSLFSLKPRDRYAALKEVGMLFQASALFDSLNVADNTAFYLKEHGNPKTGKRYSEKEIEQHVAEALALVGLEGTEKLMPSDLSGGMRKRAALARMIISHPRMLLYDEPTTGLDPITAMQINELILQIQKELHTTSIVVTHDLCSAFHVADRLALIHGGKILHIATKEKFITIDDPIIQQFIKNSMPERRAGS
jgi:phospholipid/cholesterol/gamma-HCH transport system ATP-binding protein